MKETRRGTRIRTAEKVGLAVAACAFLLAACGGSSGVSNGVQTNNSVGSGDKAICTVISQASTAYDANQFGTWRADMVQIGNMAASAQNTTIKTFADRVKQAYDTPSTHKNRGNFSGLEGLAGYVQLKKTCAKLHL